MNLREAGAVAAHVIEAVRSGELTELDQYSDAYLEEVAVFLEALTATATAMREAAEGKRL